LYTITVPFTDYKKKVRNEPVSFNLDAREVFKMLPQLKNVFEWLDSHKNADPRDLTTVEVSQFYTEFEGILLEAYGEVSEDGLYFKKGNKYEFEESALFNACMVMFVTQPQETVKLLEGILPKELFDQVKNASQTEIEQITTARAEQLAAENELLREQLKSQSTN
jgi:hypothetical protein